MVFDFLMVVAVIVTAPLYAVLGRDSAISLISAFGAITGDCVSRGGNLFLAFRSGNDGGISTGTLASNGSTY